MAGEEQADHAALHAGLRLVWLNTVEIFFGIITRQAIRRGTFTSVKDVIAAIGNRGLERTLPALRLDQDCRRDAEKATGGQRASFTRH
jgi:hypothetical protein